MSPWQWNPFGHGIVLEHAGGITQLPPTQMLPGGHPFWQSPVTGRHCPSTQMSPFGQSEFIWQPPPVPPVPEPPVPPVLLHGGVSQKPAEPPVPPAPLDPPAPVPPLSSGVRPQPVTSIARN